MTAATRTEKGLEPFEVNRERQREMARREVDETREVAVHYQRLRELAHVKSRTAYVSVAPIPVESLIKRKTASQ